MVSKSQLRQAFHANSNMSYCQEITPLDRKINGGCKFEKVDENKHSKIAVTFEELNFGKAPVNHVFD